MNVTVSYWWWINIASGSGLELTCIKPLTHWGRVTHICVSKQTIIGSDNGLSPGWRQAIIWTNDGILLIGPLGTNFSEISSEIQTFSFKKMHLNMSSVKWHPFCLGLNVLTEQMLTQIYIELEIVDQWSTRIPPPPRGGWHCAKSQGSHFESDIASWQSLGFYLQPQRTCTWNLKLKFQSKLELRCRNHAIQKPKNLIWAPCSHLENEVTENQLALTHMHKYFATEVWSWYSKPK